MYKVNSTIRTCFKICDSITLDSGITIPTISGQTGMVDEISQNGYRYRKGFWDKVLADPIVQDMIASHDCLATIEHPQDDDAFLRTPYEQASHIVLKAWVQDGNPYATFGLLNNEKGNNIKALVDVGHCPGVSTRGMGNFDRDSISQFVCEENYLFITWDIVRNPNFATLKMSEITDSITTNPIFKELVDAHQIKDSAYKGYNKDALLRDMGNMISELQEKYKQLTEVTE